MNNTGFSNKTLIVLILIIIILVIGIVFIYFNLFKKADVNENVNVVKVNENINTTPVEPEVKLNKLQQACKDEIISGDICTIEVNGIFYDLMPEEYADNLFQYTLNEKDADEIISKIKNYITEISNPSYFQNTSKDELKKKKDELIAHPYVFVNDDGEVNNQKIEEYKTIREEFKDKYYEIEKQARNNGGILYRKEASSYFENNDYFSLTLPYIKNLYSCIGSQDIRTSDEAYIYEERVKINPANTWCNSTGPDFIESQLSGLYSNLELLHLYHLLPPQKGIDQKALKYLCNEDANDNRALYHKQSDFGSGRLSFSSLLESSIQNDVSLCGKEYSKDSFVYYYCQAVSKTLNSADNTIVLDEISEYVNKNMSTSIIAEQLMWGASLGLSNNSTYTEQLEIKNNLLSNADQSKEKYLELVKNNILTMNAIFKQDVQLCDLIQNDPLRQTICISALSEVKLEDNWCYQELLKFTNNFNEKY